jgi:hypothetical protein
MAICRPTKFGVVRKGSGELSLIFAHSFLFDHYNDIKIQNFSLFWLSMIPCLFACQGANAIRSVNYLRTKDTVSAFPSITIPAGDPIGARIGVTSAALRRIIIIIFWRRDHISLK